MKIIHVTEQIQEIGYQTENNRTQVVFPMADVMEEFPGGMATLLILRKNDTEPYPSTTAEMDGTDLVWTVQSYDIAEKGYLKAQLIYTVGETVAKTQIFRFMVGESLLNASEEPPEWEDWVEGLLQAASNVHGEIEAAEETLGEAVIAAEESARQAKNSENAAYDFMTDAALSEYNANTRALAAEGYVYGTQNGEPVESGSPYHNNNAMYYANEAGNSAETAVGAKNIAVEMVNSIDVQADTLSPSMPATAHFDHSGNHTVLYLGIPRGAVGSSGVYYGTSTPTDPAINVWIDPSDGTTITNASGVSF